MLLDSHWYEYVLVPPIGFVPVKVAWVEVLAHAEKSKLFNILLEIDDEIVRIWVLIALVPHEFVPETDKVTTVDAPETDTVNELVPFPDVITKPEGTDQLKVMPETDVTEYNTAV